ncbi:MAG: hypothetical protein NC209_03900 [Alistipes sp.]|nr:hypothetical protein [Lachnospiraceae bacterium]MCM1250275.1 hypothetical protein [Alistipes sp.]
MKDYGNTFNAEKVDAMSVERITVWKSAREFFPGGAYLAPSDDYPVGTRIPALTPISVEKPGGTPTLNGAAPLGLTYEDAYVGTDGCTLTIVTSGEALVSRSEATITEAQQQVLFGRISFIKEA